MIRYSKAGKDGAPPSAPPRSVSGGDPKLKVALPSVNISPSISVLGHREQCARCSELEAEVKRLKVELARNAVTQTVTHVTPTVTDGVTRNAERQRRYRERRKAQGTPPTQG